ncbi:hypothetical protein [Candidatus Azobacteroides pseudotrichonymphae]|uniref:Uncharacterized protein n=1 Tax=Azobacteroides pseudotrichonymphae genomovar. CFP2 TaxID=511995 RepID=B6YRY1_AZOPC|nr:hypothetical protein [Candidatus Azobacteroides pseudotrichonymphae]BAG83953.1 hypothetical protein CFPG_690 [Candidatus Azobacteroides pseudotrichonymphae genomovar. CFP2]
MKYRILLLFSILTFGLFFPKANNSALAQSNEDFATILYKTREEVRDITYELKNTLSDRKKLLLEMNTLTNDIDKVLLKFKNQQIKDFNNEIRNIAKRIKTVADKYFDSASKIDDFNKRKAAVDCQLDENPRLKNLVYREWETLLSDDKRLLTEMDYLMKDIDRVIGNIDRREITNYNN